MTEYEAGRELDADIHQEVFGHDSFETYILEDEDPDGNLIGGGVLDEVPHYSTDIAAAWEVWERLLECHFFVLGKVIDWVVWEPDSGELMDRYAEAETAPLAICRAALKVMEHD